MANFVAWKPYYSVNDDSLDGEHKTILGLINELYEAIASDSAEAKRTEILDRLLHYTVTHFKHEEQLMLECGYPELQQHKLVHERLRQRTADFRNHLNLVTARDVLGFLKNWWCEHIQEKDKAYSPYLQVAVR